MILASSGVREGHMKGFTLIELLVVIAIIGVLSSVVLASLNTARNKGADTAVRTNLAGARAQAELFYDANANNYVGVADVCVLGASATGGVKGIHASVLAAAAATMATPAVTLNDPTPTQAEAICNSTASAWAAQAPIKSSAGSFCVDSTGAAVLNTTASILSGATDVAC